MYSSARTLYTLLGIEPPPESRFLKSSNLRISPLQGHHIKTQHMAFLSQQNMEDKRKRKWLVREEEEKMMEEAASEEEWRTIISTTDNGMVGHPLPLVKGTVA